MKKVIYFAMACVLMLSLAACGSNEPTGDRKSVV